METNKDDFLIEVCLIGDIVDRVDDAEILVGSDSDYVQACQAIRMTAAKRTGLKIFVRRKLHYAWLQSYLGQTGLSSKFIEMTPRIILSDLWSVLVPDWVTDEMIVSQGLLEIEIDPNLSTNFEGLLLSHYFGKAFLSETLTGENVSDIITRLTDPNAQEQFKKIPILLSCLEKKCNKWSENSKVKWVKSICDSIVVNIDNLWKELTFLTILFSYPEKLLQFVMPQDRIIWFKDFPIEGLKGIPLNPVAVEQATTQIAMFFKDVGVSLKSSEDFLNLIAATSGRLQKEFGFLKELLISGHIDISEIEINQLRKKFSHCPGVSAATLAYLQRFITVSRPTISNQTTNWETDQWTRWCVEEYMPYRKWQIDNRKFDDQVEVATQAFTDWYLENYVDIHKDSSKSLVHLFQEWSKDIEDDEFSLILLVDSLPLFFWNLFESTLIEVGFHRNKCSERFVPLPSTTETCKPLLLTGMWTENEKEYKKILNNNFKKKHSEKVTFYLSSHKDLLEFEPLSKPTIALLNYLTADELLHSDIESKASTYDEELYLLFSRLASTVRSLFDKWTGDPRRFGIYVVTDHGATKILEEEGKTLDSKVMSKLFPDEKHRFSKIKKTDLPNVPVNLWSLGYQFVSPFVDEELVYFMPRGHNTVQATGVHTGFVHGGASPEEVVVRSAIFRTVKTDFKRPGLRFLNLAIDHLSSKPLFYVQRVIKLNIELQNPNSEPITITHVDIMSPDTDIKGYTTPVIEGLGYGTIQIDCYFNKSAQGSDELTINVAYEIGSEEYKIELKQTSLFRTATSPGFSLKDLK